jgi:hypothetical protein
VDIMAIGERTRNIRRAAGLAVATAPKVRRVARDEELRQDVAGIVRAARDLVREVAADETIRRDLNDLVTTAVDGATRVREDVHTERRPRALRVIVVGGLLFVAGAAVIAALVYPRSRQTIVRAAGETRERATTTVHDARERFGRRGQGVERQAA